MTPVSLLASIKLIITVLGVMAAITSSASTAPVECNTGTNVASKQVDYKTIKTQKSILDCSVSRAWI